MNCTTDQHNRLTHLRKPGSGCLPALLVFLLLTASVVRGQTGTVSLPELAADPGTTITIPLDVSGFTDIGAITLFFTYETNVLTYNTALNPALAGIQVNSFINGVGDHVVALSWSSAFPVTLEDCTLIEFVFEFAGGTTDLLFDEPACEVAQVISGAIEVMELEYQHGEVTQNTSVGFPWSGPTEPVEASVSVGPGKIYLSNHTGRKGILELYDYSGRSIATLSVQAVPKQEWACEHAAATWVFRLSIAGKTLVGKPKRIAH